MDFISAEEFLKQDKKVQKVFIDWWEPSVGDLYYYNFDQGICEANSIKNYSCESQMKVDRIKELRGVEDGHIIPLLTEGQLRKFIEDKTECKSCSLLGEYGYQIVLYKFNSSLEIEEENYCQYYNDYDPMLLNTSNLFEAYWKVALEIAKESVKNEL